MPTRSQLACKLQPLLLLLPCCTCCYPYCCTGRDKVELLLSMGASRLEATRDVVARAARMAFTPLLNSMNVVVREGGGGGGGALRVWAAEPPNAGVCAHGTLTRSPSMS